MSEILNWIKAEIGIDLTRFASWVKETIGLELDQLLLGGLAILLVVELFIHVRKKAKKKKPIY